MNAPSSSAQPMPAPDPTLDAFLLASNLAQPGESAAWSALTGGVSSDIWRVDLPGRSLCVKRALAKLKVAADWQAPVTRNAYEWAWLQFAAKHCPDNVPQPLAHDTQAGLFAMAFLPPQAHPIWKQQLLVGDVDITTAQAVGDVLGRLHRASARQQDVARDFDSTENFHALRLEPYFIATAKRHPEVAQRLEALVARTASTRIALVHGDVSPKNILCGPKGPVFLDAECAWYGDPAFDLAFCLNHLLLKRLVQPNRREELYRSFEALVEAYFKHADWEPVATLECRAADLLPGLLLARCDGKSPVEYLTRDSDRETIRSVSLSLLQRPVERLMSIAQIWFSVTDRP